MKTAGVASPCINICRMDEASGLCIGCFRSLDEISRWSRTGDDDKIKILAAVEKRRLAVAHGGTAATGPQTST